VVAQVIYFYRERKRIGRSASGIPELMLKIDGLVNLVGGLQLLIFGFLDSRIASFQVASLFITLCPGSSLATNALAAIYFMDLEASLRTNKLNQAT